MLELTAAEGVARLLAFAYYVVAARVLAPSGFGVVSYTIALSTIGFVLMQVLGLAIGRELGTARGDAERTRTIIGASLGIGAAVLAVTLVLTAAAGALGLTGSADVLGLLVVLVGRALFEAYYAIGRGTGDTGRMAITYVGGSLTQLVSFLVIVAFTDPSPQVALLVFGLSSVVPIVACEAVSPIVRGIGVTYRHAVALDLWRIAGPVLVAHVVYLVWSTADQVWVQGALGTHAIGIYGSARNLAQIFIVIPAGVTGALVPRVAQLHAAGEAARARRLVNRTAAVVLGVSALMALVVIVLRAPLIELLYGSAYASAAPSLTGLSVAGAVYAAVVVLTAAAVGWGRPLVYVAGISVAAVTEVGYLLLVGGDEPATAAWASAGSITIALIVVAGWLTIKPFRSERPAAPRPEP